MSERIFAQIYGEIERINRRLDETRESLAYQHTGSGAPSHEAAEGVFYWDYTNDDLYVNTDGSTTWQAIGGGGPAGAHVLLSATHTDTTAASVQRGSLIIGLGASTTWQRRDHPGGINYYLRSNAADPDWTPNLTMEEAAWIGIPGGADVRISFSAVNGQINLVLGDNAGADNVNVVDSDGAVQAYIDSDANAEFSGHGAFGSAAVVGTNAWLTVNEATTAVNGTYQGGAFLIGLDPSAGFSTAVQGVEGGVELGTAQTSAGAVLVGVDGWARVDNGVDARSVAAMYGGRFTVDVEDAGSGGGAGAATAAGLAVQTPDVDTGVCTVGYGILITEGTVGAGSITTLFGLYMAEMSTGWAIYSDGGNSYHEDRVKIGGAASVSAQLHVDQDSSSGAVPVLLLDQGDTSEQCIQFSSDSADRDINLWTLDVTGAPVFLWDESEDAYVFDREVQFEASDTTRVLMIREHGDVAATGADIYANAQLGLAADTNVLVFIDADNSGSDAFFAINYNVEVGTGAPELFRVQENGRVGVLTNSPSGLVHADQTSSGGGIPVLYLDQADVSEEFIRFQGTAADGVLTQSIVDYGDESTATEAVWLKVHVIDDGNQVTDQAYHILGYVLA